MKSIHFYIALFLLSLLSILALTEYRSATYSSAFPADEQAVTVGMTNTMNYTPDTVRIKIGETVLWKNTSLLAHTVTGDPSESTIKGSAKLPVDAEPFNSGMLDPEQTFRHTFQVTGTYQYFCIPHEGAKMYGWVIVESHS